MNHWKQTTGNRQGSVLVIGEYPTSEEARKGKPFSSAAGEEVKKFIRFAGIPSGEVLFTSLAKAYPSRGDMKEFFYSSAEAKKSNELDTKGLYPNATMTEWRRELMQLIEEMKPSFIIAMGAYVTWALIDEGFDVGNEKGFKVAKGMGKWRGSHLDYKGIPLLPTYEANMMMKVWPWTFKVKHDIAARYRIWKAGKWADIKRHFIIRPSYLMAVSFLKSQLCCANEGALPLAIDIETRHNHIACIGLAYTITDAICIPFMQSSEDPDKANYWSPEEEYEIIRLLRELLTHPNVEILGQNFLFDSQFFAYYWQFKPYTHDDTMIMQHVLFPGTELDLNTISSMYCTYHKYWKDDGKYWDAKMGEEQLWVYNCRDCVVTFEAAMALRELIKYYKMEEQWGYQQRQLQSLLTVMLRGVKINLETKHNAHHKLEAVVEEYQKNLEEMLPENVWPRDPKKSSWYSSPDQVKKIFTEVFGIKPFFNKRKRAYTVDDAALEYFGRAEPIVRELTDVLREYRSLSTFQTFTTMKLDPDNRMRTSYAPTAETFRYKSSSNVFGNGGNLQNLPKGNEE